MTSNHQLFVQNLAPHVTEEHLRELFSGIGEVVEVRRPLNRETKEPRNFAFITMADEASCDTAIKHFNETEYEGKQLVVKISEAPKPRKKPSRGKPKRQLTPAQKLATTIINDLNENEKRPRAQIYRIVEECGEEFTQKLFDEATSIYDGDGMMTLDETRKRTKGGIFFKLAKERIPEEIRVKIFPNWRELKKQRKAEKAEQRAAEEEAEKATEAKSKAEPATDEIRQQFADLQKAEKAVQKRLKDMRKSGVKAGMLEVLKEAADLKGQISGLLKKYPDLK